MARPPSKTAFVASGGECVGESETWKPVRGVRDLACMWSFGPSAVEDDRTRVTGKAPSSAKSNQRREDLVAPVALPGLVLLDRERNKCVIHVKRACGDDLRGGQVTLSKAVRTAMLKTNTPSGEKVWGSPALGVGV